MVHMVYFKWSTEKTLYRKKKFSVAYHLLQFFISYREKFLKLINFITILPRMLEGTFLILYIAFEFALS